MIDGKKSCICLMLKLVLVAVEIVLKSIGKVFGMDYIDKNNQISLRLSFYSNRIEKFFQDNNIGVFQTREVILIAIIMLITYLYHIVGLLLSYVILPIVYGGMLMIEFISAINNGTNSENS